MQKRLLLTLLAGIFVFSCAEDRLPLPVPNQTEDAFGASDTNYVELNPRWQNSTIGLSFSDPQDITIGPDGILFVTDTENNRVLPLSRSGELLHGAFDNLTSIPHPYGVSIDSKLNVLVTNGSHTVYAWNQYLNLTDIDSVANSALFYDERVDAVREMTFDAYIDSLILGMPELEMVKLRFTNDPALVDSLRAVYPIFKYKEDDAQINGVAAGAFGSDVFYITESNYDKISQIRIVPQMAAKTHFGSVLFRYRGLFVQDIANYGSGAGTVDDPWGIECDKDGNIYFTQLGGNFRVQKLNSPNFEPAYILGVHDIMDLGRFDQPHDIALDDQNNIFVIDTALQTVSKFNNAGRRAGQQAKLGRKGLATAEFNAAKGIMVESNIVYVVESGENRIRRYQYSLSEEDVPDDKKP